MKNPEKYECGLKYPNAGDFRNFIVCARESLSGPSSSVKKKKYNYKFQADWMKDFQFLRPRLLSNESSFCTLCSVNFSDVSIPLSQDNTHNIPYFYFVWHK
jgi:hypothetical protein